MNSVQPLSLDIFRRGSFSIIHFCDTALYCRMYVLSITSQIIHFAHRFIYLIYQSNYLSIYQTFLTLILYIILFFYTAPMDYSSLFEDIPVVNIVLQFHSSHPPPSGPGFKKMVLDPLEEEGFFLFSVEFGEFSSKIRGIFLLFG